MNDHFGAPQPPAPMPAARYSPPHAGQANPGPPGAGQNMSRPVPAPPGGIPTPGPVVPGSKKRPNKSAKQALTVIGLVAVLAITVVFSLWLLWIRPAFASARAATNDFVAAHNQGQTLDPFVDDGEDCADFSQLDDVGVIDWSPGSVAVALASEGGFTFSWLAGGDSEGIVDLLAASRPSGTDYAFVDGLVANESEGTSDATMVLTRAPGSDWHVCAINGGG